MSKSLSRRNFIATAAAAAFTPRIGHAQEFPTRPIRLMIGVPPGGSIDFGARVIAPALGEALGTTVLVENRPGANGVLCTEQVVNSAGDGYTLLFGTPSPIIIAPQAMPQFKFNPVVDLKGINMVSTTAIAIGINPALPVKNITELVALSRKRPITLGLPTAGSVSHLVVEMVAKATGCNITYVPYKGGGPALNDTVGGHIDATVSDVGVFLPFHKEGRVRILLVSSEKRLPDLREVRTADEDAPGLVVTNWLGVFAPASTPAAIISRINAGLVKATARQDVREAFRKASAEATVMASPEAFQKHVASEYVRFGRILRERNITL